MSPSQQKELILSSNTSPDDVTGHALSWIITHSQNSETRQLAVRASSALKSEDTLQQLVMRPPGILPQVIQSFTSCFSAHTWGGQLEFNKGVDIDLISLHGQALSILVNRVVDTSDSDRTNPGFLATWGVDSDTVLAVEKRFQLYVINARSRVTHANSEARRLADNLVCITGSILGLIGLSAWYEFVGHNGELRFNRGDILLRLAQSFTWSLPTHIHLGILHALLIESSYWTPDINNQCRVELLRILVQLIPTAPYELRSKLACSLVRKIGRTDVSAQRRLWLSPPPTAPHLQ